MLSNLLSMILAVSIFAGNAVARPHQHLTHRNLHEALRARHNVQASVEKRDALTDLQSEVKSFEGFMNQFIQSASTSQDAITKLQGQVQTHIQAIQTYADASGNSSSTTGGSVPQLQSDSGAFKSWIDTWVQDIGFTSSSDAISVLSQELQSYTGWLNAWLGISGPSTGSVPTQSLTSVYLPSPTGSTTLLTMTVSQTSTDVIVATQTLTGFPSSSAAASPTLASPSIASASPSEAPTTSAAVSVPTTPAAVSSPALPSSSPIAASSPAAVSSAAPSPSLSSSGSGSGSTGSGAKLAAWWGQTAAASTYSLSQICADPSFDIVMLSFLNDFFTGGGMPTLNLGSASGKPSAAQIAAGATGLFDGSDGTDVLTAIQACQSSGKKVMLTLGGAEQYSQSSFASDDQAEGFAGTIWDLFLGGESELRPFGSVKLDGIDVDNENKDQTGYAAFVKALRGKFAEDGSKEYLISGAPQCPIPDASIPQDALSQMDIVSGFPRSSSFFLGSRYPPSFALLYLLFPTLVQSSLPIHLPPLTHSYMPPLMPLLSPFLHSLPPLSIHPSP